MAELELQTVLVRYRVKGGQLKFEFITGTAEQIEARLLNYLETKDAHSLMILGYGQGQVLPTEFDAVENATVTMDLAHHMVHEEKSFTTSDVDLNVQIAAPKYWLIRVPENLEFHMKISVECDTGSLLEFFEDPTINVDGVNVPFYNNNRISSKTTNMTCYSNPTVGADGTRLQVSRVGAGREKKLGGVGRTQFEWILKSGEEYLIKITVDANGAQVTFTMDGYQVD